MRGRYIFYALDELTQKQQSMVHPPFANANSIQSLSWTACQVASQKWLRLDVESGLGGFESGLGGFESFGSTPSLTPHFDRFRDFAPFYLSF